LADMATMRHSKKPEVMFDKYWPMGVAFSA